MRTLLERITTGFQNILDRCSAPSVTSWLGLLVFGSGVILAMVLGGGTLRAKADSPVQSVTIRFMDAPAWIGESLHGHLTDLAAPWLLNTTLNRTALINAREALIASGCFAEVTQVRRAGNQAVEIDAVFLKPWARVLDAGRNLLVDREGFVLPSGYRIGESSHLVQIIAPTYQAPEHAGHRWPGDDMAASLLLLDTIDDQVWYEQITAIDLSEFKIRQQLVLVTDLGTRILWGSIPGRETPMEALTHDKIQRLDWFHTYHGRVDQHHRGIIDVTDAGIVTKR